jgi:hypothetical protein
MAIPGNRLSTTPILGAYLSPYDREMGPFLDYEQGGIALDDPSQGLQVQVWRLDYAASNGDFLVTPESFGSPSVQYTDPGAIVTSLAFDQSMRVVLAWIKDGDVFLRWFDPLPNMTVISNFGPAQDARVLLDDPRELQTIAGSSDVLLFYVRGGRIYYRQQRDRFTIERELGAFINPNALIVKYGRTNRLRIQFEVTPP